MRKDDFWDGTKWVADPARQQPDAELAPPSARRWGKAALTVALTAAMMIPFSAIATASTKSGPGSGSVASIALAAPTGQALTSSYPSLGTSVSFVTVVPSTAKNPAIALNCYQGGTVVWSYVGATTSTYKLGGDSSPWLANGGSASCVAQLVSVTWKAGVESMTQLASTSFTASAN